MVTIQFIHVAVKKKLYRLIFSKNMHVFSLPGSLLPLLSINFCEHFYVQFMLLHHLVMFLNETCVNTAILWMQNPKAFVTISGHFKHASVRKTLSPSMPLKREWVKMENWPAKIVHCFLHNKPWDTIRHETLRPFWTGRRKPFFRGTERRWNRPRKKMKVKIRQGKSNYHVKLQKNVTMNL